MKRLLRIALACSIISSAGSTGWGSFHSFGQVAISAGTTTGVGSSLTITALPLPGQAFFGKNVIIPVQVTNASGPINTKNLQVDIVYQLLDKSGSALNPPTSVPIQFAPSPTNANTIQGTAIIPRTDLSPIQNGGTISYVFSARQGSSNTVLGAAGISQVGTGGNVLQSPFQTSIIDQLCIAVGPAGARISAPDLVANDGRTTVALAPNAVASAGTLCLQQEDSNAWPLGPGGSKAVSVYSVTLHDTALTGTAQLVLSYPSDVSGKVLDPSADPTSLGIYWLDQNALPHASGLWLPLSRATIDTTLHTVTGMTAHFSVFALFAAGAIGAADLRPSQRIITPNGDGINDTASFSGLGVGEEAKIFDVRGRRVRTLPGPSPVWDGKDDDGKTVESGVYIYQYSSQGERVSGVIAVAK